MAISCAAALRSHFCPVSYTHLDVYKRQLTSYELACSKGWKSDAGSLQMSKGMVIEKGADGKIHVLTVSEVEEAVDMGMINRTPCSTAVTITLVARSTSTTITTWLRRSFSTDPAVA